MSTFLQLTVAGLGTGAAYGLIALGFVLIHAVTGYVNIAQGQFAAVGALVTASLTGRLPLLIAIALAIVGTALASVACEQLVLAPARTADTARYLIITLGLLFALEGASLIVWGADPRAVAPLTAGTFVVGGVIVTWQSLWVCGAAIVIPAVLGVVLRRTTVGLQLRASAQQPVAALLVGISPRRIARVVFATAGVVAAVGGILVSPLQLTSWDTGLTLGLKAFVAASLAGFGSLWGAVAGGILLGLAEQLAAGYVGSGYKEAVAYTVLLALLVVRPTGLVRSVQVKV